MSDSSDADRSERGGLASGTRVEVRTGFDRSWASGFEIERWTEDGYLVKRRSDGQLLPVEISPADVRKERKKQMWWY